MHGARRRQRPWARFAVPSAALTRNPGVKKRSLARVFRPLFVTGALAGASRPRNEGPAPPALNCLAAAAPCVA